MNDKEIERRGSRQAGRLERLSPLDVSNLRVEEHGLPMHVAALAILEGAPLLDAFGHLRLDALRGDVERRLHLAPRLRQVLYRPRLGLGPHLWIDDAGFDIREHVRTHAVPAPGDEETLLGVCSELNEPRLDRSRPLWELWLLTGLAGGHVGVLLRLHHVVADGTAALALLGRLFEAAPHPQAPVVPPWAPRPMPGGRELAVDNLRQRAVAVTKALSRFRRPASQVRRLGVLAGQVRRLLDEGLAPRVSLNRPVGRHRRLALVRADLDAVKAVAHANGGAVNDVSLAAIAGGAGRLLEARGELKPGLVLKASVATSIRAAADEQTSGNLVGIMLAPLPVGDLDPIRRLQVIARATAERKRRPPYQPSARFAQRWMVRAMVHQRMVNLFTSNLPGPPTPLYFAGARVLELFQVGVVQGNVTVGVGVLSYAGQLTFDIVGDAESVPDLPMFAEGLSAALEELGVGLHRPRLLVQGGIPAHTEIRAGPSARGEMTQKEAAMKRAGMATLAALALAAYDAVVRPRMLEWGSTRDGRQRPLPGDDVTNDIVPAGTVRHTRGLTTLRFSTHLVRGNACEEPDSAAATSSTAIRPVGTRSKNASTACSLLSRSLADRPAARVWDAREPMKAGEEGAIEFQRVCPTQLESVAVSDGK